MEDIKKSLMNVLNERIASPLWGTFIITWLVCNWKIWYVTLFVDSNKLDITKLQYIQDYLNTPFPFKDTYVRGYLFFSWIDLNLWHLFIFPAFFTWIILQFVPILSNIVYGWSVKHNNKRLKISEEVIITVAQATQLRKEKNEQGDVFKKSMEDMDQKIEELEAEKTILTNERNELERRSHDKTVLNDELERRLKEKTDLNDNLIKNIQELNATNEKIGTYMKTETEKMEQIKKSHEQQISALNQEVEEWKKKYAMAVSDKNELSEKYLTAYQMIEGDAKLHGDNKIGQTLSYLLSKLPKIIN